MGFFDALSNPLEWIVEQLFMALYQALDTLLNFMMDNTEPELFFSNNADGSRSNFFLQQYGLMIEIGVYVTVPLVICATISALMKGGMRQVLHTYLVGLPVSMLGAVAALVFANLAQLINQNIVEYFDDSMQSNMQQYVDGIEGFVDVAQNFGGFLMFGGILAIAIILAVFALVVELIAREITIYTTMLFMPLAFAAYVWPATRKWLLNMIELVLAMIFSKAIMVSVLSLGFAAVLSGLGGGSEADEAVTMGRQVAALGLGALLLFTAAFAMPVLVNFALAPNSAPPLDRKGVQNANPWNSNRAFSRSQYVSTVKTTFKRPGQSNNLRG